jgi:thiamine transport system permease protein
MSRRTTALLAAVPVLFLAVFFAYPVLSILGRGLAPDGELDLGVLGEVLGRRRTWDIAWFTFWQAAVSTALTIAVGLPVAHVFARFRFPGQRGLRAALTVPFVMPTVVVATAFLTLLGPAGPLPIDLRRTIWAVLIAHVFFNVAVVVRTVGGAWANLDPRPEEAARVLGAGRLRTFVEITLPRLAPALGAAAALVFLFTFTSFGVVLILGGPSLATLEVETYVQTVTFLNLDVAAVLALLQLTAVVVLLVVQRRLLERPAARQGQRQRSADVASRRPRTLGERLWVTANLALVGVLLGTPLLLLVERSFRTGDGYGLGNWRALGERGRGSTLFVTPWEAVRNSLWAAVIASAIALAVGGLAAAAIAYGRGATARTLDTSLMLPLGTSAATIGFGFLIALDSPPLDLRSSPWIVPIAHALVAVPFVIRVLVPSMRAVDQRLRDAAAVLGAPPGRVWREVDLPIVARAGIVATGFAFAISMGEFGATAFLARPDRPTIPTAIYRFLGRPGALNVGQALAMSVILMVVTATAVMLIERFRVGGVGEF